MKRIKRLIRKLIVFLLCKTDQWVVPDKIYELIDGSKEERLEAKAFLESIEFDYDYDPRLRSALSLVGFLERVE